MNSIRLTNFAQLKHADIALGDLTVLVGRQASGKTLLLETLKLLVDTGYVHSELSKHGLAWGRDFGTFFDVFYGEGMANVWSAGSTLEVDGHAVPFDDLVTRRNRSKKNRMFYVPAQRVLTLSNGWPLPFQSYGAQDPYVVREFSEAFRRLMDKEFATGGALFPQTNRLKKPYRELLVQHVFQDYELSIDTHGAQRRLVLRDKDGESQIPFMTWSAGQREFVPLLMGLYWLLPASKVSRRDDLEWVVLEEPETGLHPAAISAVLLIVLDLLKRGYRVCLSTHSPHVLDVVWALQTLKHEGAASDRVLQVFGARRNAQTRSVASSALKKEYRVHYFDVETGKTQEISSLNPGSPNAVEAGWGGLTDLSGQAADTIAKVLAESDS